VAADEDVRGREVAKAAKVDREAAQVVAQVVGQEVAQAAGRQVRDAAVMATSPMTIPFRKTASRCR